MKIEKIETCYDRYILEFSFRFPIDGQGVYVWITAFEQKKGGRSEIGDINGVVDQFPEWVHGDPIDEKAFWMLVSKYPEFVKYIANLDPTELFKLLDKDQAEGEWEQ